LPYYSREGKLLVKKGARTGPFSRCRERGAILHFSITNRVDARFKKPVQSTP